MNYEWVWKPSRCALYYAPDICCIADTRPWSASFCANHWIQWQIAQGKNWLEELPLVVFASKSQEGEKLLSGPQHGPVPLWVFGRAREIQHFWRYKKAHWYANEPYNRNYFNRAAAQPAPTVSKTDASA